MSDFIEVMVIVEGKTEEIFIEKIVRPYLADKNIFITATQISKQGQKGGDVKFSRAQNDLGTHLKQRSDTYVTTFVDYYGIKEWPGLEAVKAGATPAEIAQTINEATKTEVLRLFAAQQAEQRFIPFIAVHEFETLLFSDPTSIAAELGIKMSEVENILAECGTPEAINNNPQSAPSKRLDLWSKNGKFKKTTTGIAIAGKIGITRMRKECPLFDEWLEQLELIQKLKRL
ncbi:MAG: DUF4276 family protein [Victivallaceae bacterium]|nr:DUF4276 family protein [Victivallaceae bacterium]